MEIACPIYDSEIKQEILDSFDIGWNDNVKGRVISSQNDNAYKNSEGPKVRSQLMRYDYYVNKIQN